MFSRELIKRARRSVAVRLSLAFALLFTVGFTALFGLLYWLLGRQLEQREVDLVKARLQEYASVYDTTGDSGLRMRLYMDSRTLNERPWFVRITASNGAVVLQSVPNDWIDEQGKTMVVPDDWGRAVEQPVYSWRVPRDQEQDLIGGRATLRNGMVLEIARTTDNRTALLQPLRRLFLLVAGAVVLVGFAIGSIAAWRAVRPLQAVVDTARRIITTGAMDARVRVPTRDNDITELVRLFNTVLDKNAGLLRSMREALDNVAHDLRTPLTSIRGTAELALANGNEGVMRDALADNVERSDEVLRLLRALMEISEADSGMMKLRKESCDFGTLARSAAELYSDVADARNQKLVVESTPAADNVVVSGDPTRLRQVFVNLIDNALKYTPDGGHVNVGVRAESRAGQEGVLLAVRDDGPGVPKAEQGRIWERLYRGDQSRSQSGLGLGLSLVRAIVAAHGGSVTVHNVPQPDHGAVFEVWLPRS